MLVGYALNALFTFSYLFVKTPFHLSLVQIGLGFATALATPTWEALYAIHQSKKTSGMTWGLAGGESSIACAVAILIGGYLVQRYSFSVLFVVMGIIQTIAMIYQARILFIKK
jgi:predicted MFS family arabinose efflux permease